MSLNRVKNKKIVEELEEEIGSQADDESEEELGVASSGDNDSDSEEVINASLKSLKLDSRKKRNKEEIVYKKRLFVGEAGFAGVAGFVKKHEATKPGVGKAIVATEYRTQAQLEKDEPGFLGNLQYLLSKGVKVLFGIDAKKLHEYKEIRECALENGTIPRIHFNFPYASNAGTTTALVSGFLASAAQLQKPGDRVHMALVQPQKTGAGNRYWWQAKQYGIQGAANATGYKYGLKRQFMNGEKNKTGVLAKDNRYDYQHAVTDAAGSASKTVKNYGGREFIFQKTDKSKLNEGKRYLDFGRRILGLEERKTDDDSSDCIDRTVRRTAKRG